MDHPSINIGGREFPVPPLALGQLAVIVPAILRLNAMNIQSPTSENIDDLNTITYLAICRGTPTFPKGEYLALAGTFTDLLLAKLVITKQCGMTQKEGDTEGEQKART